MKNILKIAGIVAASAAIVATAQVFSGGRPGYILVGPSSQLDGSALTGIPASALAPVGQTFQVTGTTNSFLELNLQNTSAGTNAAGDFVATADNGTATFDYVDLGINGSHYDVNYFGNTNDSFLIAQGAVTNGAVGGNLFIGTGSTNKTIVLVNTAAGTGGYLSQTNVATISASNAVFSVNLSAPLMSVSASNAAVAFFVATNMAAASFTVQPYTNGQALGQCFIGWSNTTPVEIIYTNAAAIVVDPLP